MKPGVWLRSQLMGILFGETHLALRAGSFALSPHFREVDALGLYLHVPFCRQICPYCPYNKEIYCPEVAERYADAVIREVEQYAEIVGNRPVTSFYIGGGTPTTMLHGSLSRVIDHIGQTFNMQCGIHMESHPNDLSDEDLDSIVALGVEHLSIGIEALQDHHLDELCRPYTAQQAKAAIERALARGFQCVNVDLMFALPNQTHGELKQAGQTLVSLGVDQIAAYPLFNFPYTQWLRRARQKGYRRYNLLQKRRMLQLLEQIFYATGYERTSVWAFTRIGVPKYCSVTIPLYLGLGASAASYLRDIFYLNTFSVSAYIRALESGQMPIALSLPLSDRMQMAGWLYWRIYETRFRRSAFSRRFGEKFDVVYGKYLETLSYMRLLHEYGDEIVLTDAGAYWLHVLQDLFSIDYVSELWGTSRLEPWPREVVL